MKRICIALLFVLVGAAAATAQSRFVFPEEVKPLIKTSWGQGYPYNKLCPWEKTDTAVRHSYAGCGPLVMSQVIRHCEYPAYSRPLGSRYDWAGMFDTVTDTTTIEQENAVARLIADCGTAGSTVYGQSASATKLNDVVTGMKKYFGYSKYMHIADRAYYGGANGSKAWKTLMYNELRGGRPVIIRGERNKHTAHVFIIDGCRDSLVHVNWGWGGKRNGYYDPDTLYGYRGNQRMVVDIAKRGYVPYVRKISVRTPGSLARQIAGQDWLDMRHVKVSGTINGDDIRLLRRLAGGARRGERNGCLSTIDLSEAVILAMPDSAFYGCGNLTFVSLPITLPEISRYAFAYCSKLNGIDIHPLVGEIKQRAFMACFNLIEISIPPSVRAIGAYAFKSCNSLTEVVLPPSVHTIGMGAFAFSKNLRSLTVPKAARNIGKDATRGTSVTKIRRL